MRGLARILEGNSSKIHDKKISRESNFSVLWIVNVPFRRDYLPTCQESGNYLLTMGSL